jgi:SMI1-KNR4 cell-wall
MAIEDLLAVVPPPARPIDPGDPAAWPKVEQALGTKLPSDYRDYGLRYGSGVLGHNIFVYNPFSPFYLGDVKNTCQLFGQMHEVEEDYFPHAVFPSSPGLLPWASDSNGNHYFWLTEGEPDQWPVLFWPRNGDEWVRSRSRGNLVSRDGNQATHG